MHYLNQFFAGMGGEQKADLPVGVIEGPVGPGKRLQSLLGDKADIVVTVYCGDNYFNDHIDTALSQILEITKARNINLVVAGPAFGSGRYGFACAQICHALSTSLDLYCVTAMHLENPGIEVYKQHKNKKVYAFSTLPFVSGMKEALAKMVRGISKLGNGTDLGPPRQGEYIPRGFRVVERISSNGVARAINMLLDKLASRPYVTEIPIESLEAIPIAPSIADLTKATLALVNTTGVVLPGNPDGFKVYKNMQWKKYSIEGKDSMLASEWDVIHGGYNTEFTKKNPNFGVPLDVCREFEIEG
jgi:betaine reductase